MSDETWRAIPGYEGAYEVSDLGRVRSLDRITDRGRRWKGRTMTPSAQPNGYWIVSLWRDGKQRTPMVHRLVLTAFVGPSADGQEALHRNGDQDDNRLANLRWGTHSENQFDQVAHGTHVQTAKSRCPSGHPYDDENTYMHPSGRHRACRTCRAAHSRKQTQKRSRKEAA